MRLKRSADPKGSADAPAAYACLGAAIISVARALILPCLAVLLLAGAPVDARAETSRPTVFAAASLQGVLGELADLHEGGAVISVSGSGAIARQIAQGAPADALILANADWMDWLEAQGLVMSAQRVDLLGNRLVLIAPAGTSPMKDFGAEALLARLNGGRMAVGQTMGVPAGIYARQWLTAAGLWSALAPHLAETDNVRTALALVARGEAPLGVVYATDAEAEPDVRVLHEIPASMHDPIVYPAASLTGAGAGFIDFLSGEEARAVFVRHGFIPLAAP